MKIKMKKSLSLLLCIVISASVFFAVPVISQAKVSKGYNYVVQDDGTVKLKSYTGDDDKVTIPEKLEGMKVTAIGSGCFSTNKDLIEITVKSNVKTFEKDIFNGCDSLLKATLNCKIKELPEGTFRGCNNLKEITLPSTLKSIGAEAFYDCASLKDIAIPDGVNKIEKSAFENCIELTKINLPDGVKELPLNAFCECRKLTSVTLPASLETIGAEAFYNCKNLKEISLPNSLKNIGDKAFFYCKELKTFTIPKSVIRVGWCAFNETAFSGEKNNWTADGCILYKDNILLRAKNVTVEDFTIADGTRVVAANAFKYSSQVQSISLPDSLISIGCEAFYQCYGLTHIIGGSKVEICGANPFCSWCPLADNIEKIDNNTYYIGKCLVYADLNYKGVLKLKKGTVSVGENMFSEIVYARDITEIYLPDSFSQDITAYDFSGCKKLKKFTVTDGNSKYSSKDGVLFKKNKTCLICFPCANGVKSYTIPNSVKTIGEYAFHDCKKLASLKIGSKVKTIGAYAFRDCSALKTVNIPKNVKAIKENAFFSLLNTPDKKWKKTTYTLKGYKGSAAEEYSKSCDIFKKKNVKFSASYYVGVPKTEIKEGKKSFSVKYNKVKNATGFEVKYTKGNTVFVKKYNTKKTATKKIKKLKKGSYSVKIRAYSMQNGQKLYGKWTKAKTIKVK